MVLKQQVLRGDEQIVVGNLTLVSVSNQTFKPVALPKILATYPLNT